MRDVDGDAQIGITDRGAGSEIATYKEEGVHSLLSGNLVDVCPVGAITTRDYRFKSRPWDNPLAADTICTFCSKGCNTTVWIKAKPEWAKGPAIARVTPRFNPEVNGYWMCDIGRFDYHWVESEARLTQPLLRTTSGVQQPVAWHDALRELAARLGPPQAGSSADEQGPRMLFLASAHASLEELHLLKSLAAAAGSAVTVSWRLSEKPQPEGVKFKVPVDDAPNVNGAIDLGLLKRRDLAELRASVEAGHVKALYVFDPGPPGTIGDLSWIVGARESGRLPLLVVQGVLHSELTAAADVVLAGSTAFEKDGSYTNDQGRVQGAATVTAAPGDALDDCLILARIGAILGVELLTPDRARTEIANDLVHLQEYATLQQMVFGRPVAARTRLQSSNPSERWKWDFLFQDVPPVKGSLDLSSLPYQPATIPLKKIAPADKDNE
jgi:NADH-quinone oxidoreductase subunit G